MKIIVTKRSDDYHACFDGFSRMWGCGPTVNAAIGDLIRSFPDFTNIPVEVNG